MAPAPSLRHRLAGPGLAVQRLINALKGPDPGLRVLLFHDVPADEMPAFRALVQWLAEQGRLAGPGHLERMIEGGAPAAGRPACVFSFDDGFASNLECGRILAEHGATGLFFVCPGLIRLRGAIRAETIAANVFRGRRAGAVPDLMEWSAVESLAAAGHAIGSHSLLHLPLAGLDPSRLQDDVAAAAAMLGERLGHPAGWFAYTFGDIGSVDAQVLATVARHHRFCRSGVRGLNRPGTHRLAVLADQVDLLAPAAWARLVCEGGLDGRYGAARRSLAALAAAATP